MNSPHASSGPFGQRRGPAKNGPRVQGLRLKTMAGSTELTAVWILHHPNLQI